MFFVKEIIIGFVSFFSFLFVDNLILVRKNLNSECLEKKKHIKLLLPLNLKKKKKKKEPRALVQRLGLNLLSPTFYNIRL